MIKNKEARWSEVWGVWEAWGEMIGKKCTGITKLQISARSKGHGADPCTGPGEG